MVNLSRLFLSVNNVGLLDVVAVDLDKWEGSRPRIWDLSQEKLRRNLFPPSKGPQHARSFAGRSREVLVEGEVPCTYWRRVTFEISIEQTLRTTSELVHLSCLVFLPILFT